MTEDLPIDCYRLTVTTVVGQTVERFCIDCQEDELEPNFKQVGDHVFLFYRGNAPHTGLELRQDTIVSREIEVIYQQPLVMEEESPSSISPDDLDKKWKENQDD